MLSNGEYALMKVQYNQQTKMTWSYIPTSVAKKLGISKGDEIDFTQLENVGGSSTETIFLVKKKVKTN